MPENAYGPAVRTAGIDRAMRIMIHRFEMSSASAPASAPAAEPQDAPLFLDSDGFGSSLTQVLAAVVETQ